MSTPQLLFFRNEPSPSPMAQPALAPSSPVSNTSVVPAQQQGSSTLNLYNNQPQGFQAGPLAVWTVHEIRRGTLPHKPCGNRAQLIPSL